MKLLAFSVIFVLTSTIFATPPPTPCEDVTQQAAISLFKINNPDIKEFFIENNFIESTDQGKRYTEIFDVSVIANNVTYSAYRMTCLATRGSDKATVISFSILKTY